MKPGKNLKTTYPALKKKKITKKHFSPYPHPWPSHPVCMIFVMLTINARLVTTIFTVSTELVNREEFICLPEEP
jgi:hypothetical protein